jgi:predicted amidophosphoribosyltransferase
MLWPELFFCPGCSLPSFHSLCRSCRGSIRPNTRPFDLGRSGLESCYPILLSAGTTRRLLRHWKEKRGTLLRNHLFRMSEGLRQSLRELGLIAIIPVPQSHERSNRRGHETSKEVAEFIGMQIGRPVVELLELSEPNPSRMTGKTRFERDHSRNPFRISSVFSSDHPVFPLLEELVLSGKEIPLLVVDDLITSGATLARAANTLHGFLPRARVSTSGLGLRPPVRPELTASPGSHSP